MVKHEQKEQIVLTRWLKILESQGKILTFFAIPNGGSRNKLEAVNMKKEGVRAGVSDMCIVAHKKLLFVEMKKQGKVLKSGKISYAGIKVSDEQEEFLNKIRCNMNVTGKVCYGFAQAKEFIEEYI